MKLLLLFVYILLESTYSLEITSDIINDAIDRYELQIEELKRFEEKLPTNDHKYLFIPRTFDEAWKQEKASLIIKETTLNITSAYCTSDEIKSCVLELSNYNYNNHTIGQMCLQQLENCQDSDYKQSYRNYNGVCNNQFKRSGRAFTVYRRLIPAVYEDHISTIRKSVTGQSLPSPRKISLKFNYSYPTISKYTLLLAYWTDFILNDMSFTTESKTVFTKKSIQCCNQDGTNIANNLIHPLCNPISVEEDDPEYKNFGVKCLPYVRSATGYRSRCTLGPIDQINQATHYLDGSQIYGMTKNKTPRLFHNGLLKTRNNFLLLHSSCTNPDSEDCLVDSGDDRVNSNPQYTILNTLLVREHNRIAMALHKLNTSWSDEVLYQEARKLVIAEIQHITYNEWLPLVVGYNAARGINNVDIKKFNIIPKISNEFNTAMRFTFNMLDGNLQLFKENRRNSTTSLDLKNVYNKPRIIENGDNFDDLLRGMATQNSLELNLDKGNHLGTNYYKVGNYGIDALTLEVQKGRDHGLAPYQLYREFFEMDIPKTFDEYRKYFGRKNARRLEKLYASPDDIDLFIGGMLEKPDPGVLVGKTFARIIENQMMQTKLGDNYFYINPKQPKPFTKQQLTQVKQATMARLICDNGHEIKQMQSSAFLEPDIRLNQLVDCSNLPFVDLLAWNP